MNNISNTYYKYKIRVWFRILHKARNPNIFLSFFTKDGWAWTSKHSKHRQSFGRCKHTQQMISSSTSSPSSHPFALGLNSPSSSSPASQNQQKAPATTTAYLLASDLSLRAHGLGKIEEWNLFLGCFCFWVQIEWNYFLFGKNGKLKEQMDMEERSNFG